MSYHRPSIRRTGYHLFFNYFFDREFCLADLLQLFFVKCSNYFIIVMVTNNICPLHSMFYFLDFSFLHSPFFCFQKFLQTFRPVWSEALCKNMSLTQYALLFLSRRLLPNNLDCSPLRKYFCIISSHRHQL